MQLNARYNAGEYSGEVKSKIGSVSQLDLQVQILSATLAYKNWTSHLSYMNGSMDQSGAIFSKYDADLNALVSANVANAQALRNMINFEGVAVNFINIGLMYDDPQGSIFQGEYTVRRFNSMSSPDTQGWYVMGGLPSWGLYPFCWVFASTYI